MRAPDATSAASKALAAVLVPLLLACAGSSRWEAGRDLEEGRLDQAIAKLEQIAADNPDSVEDQVELGAAYFLKARKALDEGDDATYVAYLGKAENAVLAGVEADPTAHSTHTWMGIISAYRSDLDGALASFRNAKRLAPRNPVAHANLAETYIYKGQLSQARRHLSHARKLGMPTVYIEMNEVLAAWRQGDYVEARDIFDGAYALNPEIVEVWNEAPVGEPIRSFEDFTGFCCGHLACGPYMADACAEVKQEVKQRSVGAETVRQELLIEMERRRRLEQIYRDKGIKIEVEPVEPTERTGSSSGG